MPQVFRHGPPDVRPINVIRPNVQRSLAGRFDRRLTTITAGPGFGKTTALVRAMAENRLSPSGLDVWLACEFGDDAESFAEGLSNAISRHVATAPASSIVGIVEAIAGLAPIEVCLVIDDIERLRGDSAQPWLMNLVKALPTNGHLLWSGRSAPPGQSDIVDRIEIAEPDLLFSDSQAAELAGQIGNAELALDSLAGWPALVEVAARRGAPLRFIDDHVLADLGDDAGLILDCLVACERADLSLLAAVVPDADLSRIDELPLVHRMGDDLVAHDIWHQLRATSERVELLREQAVEVLAAGGDYERTLDVLLIGTRFTDPGPADIERRGEAMLRVLHPNRSVPAERLRIWEKLVRRIQHVGPGDELLRGLVLRLDAPAGDECVERITHAAATYAAEGNLLGEAIALSALTYPLHCRQDSVRLRATFTRINELSRQGVEQADQQAKLASATVATATGDLETVEAVTRELVDTAPPGPARTAALWMLCNALNGTGRSSLDLADRLAAEPAQLPGMCAAPFTARWQLGMVDDLRARSSTKLNGDRDRYVMAVWNTYLSLVTGELDAARAHLEVVREFTVHGLAADGSNVLPEVALAVEERRDADAGTLTRSLLQKSPLDGPARGYHLMGAGLIYILLPESRDQLKAVQGGPLITDSIEMADAYVEIVERGEDDAIRRLRLPSGVGPLLTSLSLRYATEYLSAAHALDLEGIDHLVEELVELAGESARAALGNATEHENHLISSGAADLLATIPIQPDGNVIIRLLGNTELEVDGRSETSADWRRERVRSLLTFVLMHPSPTRELAMSELWPDTDAEAARRNFRSTLNRLHRVLEPKRMAGHAPFHVQSVGQSLSFRPGDRAAIDVHRFQHEVQIAAQLESDGTPSLAIDHYIAAVDLYRGDLLPDSYSPWVLVQRDALRTRFANAGVRCAELLSAAGRLEESQTIARRVLTIEPYSEAAHRALITSHLAGGDLTAARRSMATCESVLADVGGVAEPATITVLRRLQRLEADEEVVR